MNAKELLMAHTELIGLLDSLDEHVTLEDVAAKLREIASIFSPVDDPARVQRAMEAYSKHHLSPHDLRCQCGHDFSGQKGKLFAKHRLHMFEEVLKAGQA